MDLLNIRVGDPPGSLLFPFCDPVTYDVEGKSMWKNWKCKAAAGLMSCGFFLFSGDVTSDILPGEKSPELSAIESSLTGEEKRQVANEIKFATFSSRIQKYDPRKNLPEKDLEELFSIILAQAKMEENGGDDSLFLTMFAVLEFKKFREKKQKELFAERMEKLSIQVPGACYLASVVCDMFLDLGKKDKGLSHLERSVTFLLEEWRKKGGKTLWKSGKKEYALYLVRNYVSLLTEKKECKRVCSFLDELQKEELFAEDLFLLQLRLLNEYFLMKTAKDEKENKLFFWQKTEKEKAEASFEATLLLYQKYIREKHLAGKSISYGGHFAFFQLLAKEEKYKEIPLQILLGEYHFVKGREKEKFLALARYFASLNDDVNVARIWKNLIDMPGFPANGAPLLVYAAQLSRAGSSAKLLAAQEKAFISKPHDPFVAVALARVYWQCSRHEEACKVLEGFPNDPEILLFSGGISMSIRHFEKALNAFLKADLLLDQKKFAPVRNKKIPLTKKGEILLSFIRRQMQIALCADHLGKYALMEKHLKKLLAEDPGNATALNFLSYSFAQRNLRLSFAESLVKLSLEKEPDNYAFLDTLAWVKYRKKEWKEAQKYILKAMEKCGKDVDSVILDHAGDIYYAQGKKKDAVKYWQQALRQYSSELNVKDVLEKLKKAEK